MNDLSYNMFCNIKNDRRILESYIHDYLDSYNRNHVLALKLYPGVGKTKSTMDIINDCEKDSIYLSPNHKLSTEISDRYHYEHMVGKSLCCINKSKFEEISKFCGSNIFCKKHCEYYKRNQCEYYIRIKELYNFPKPWIGVHSHIPNLYEQFRLKNEGLTDITIIDENFMESLFNQKKIRRESLMFTKEFCEYEDLNIILKEIIDVMNEDKPFDNDYITQMISDLNINSLYEELERTDEHLLGLYERNNPMKYKKNWLGTFTELSLLAKSDYLNEGYMKIDSNNLDLMYFAKIKERGSTIILDATFDRSVNGRLFLDGTNFDIQELDEMFTNRQNRYQFKETFISGKRSNTFPMSSLYRSNSFTPTFYTLTKLARLICERHIGEKTLIISRKKHGILDEIRKEIDMVNVEYLNYGASRGINKYENFNNVILFGTPFPNPNLVSRKAKVLGVEEELIIKFEREDEMFQSLFRIRPLEKDCSIYVFSSLPIFRDNEGIISNTPTEMIKILENRFPLNLTNSDVVKLEILKVIGELGTLKKSEILGHIRKDEHLIKKCLKELISEGKVIEEPIRVGKARATIFLRLK